MTTSIVSKGTSEVYDALGATVGFLVSQKGADGAYCIMEGSIPPGYSVPLHRHSDEESFFVLSGTVNVWTEHTGWSVLRKGDFIHIPGNTKHAWKNESATPFDSLIVTTPRLGVFFKEIGTRVEGAGSSTSPTPGQLEHFMETSRRYGHWLGSPEENAAVGIEM